MLHIFPPGFEGTLLVPVLVGLLIMAVSTEWFGWDFVGIVVPGYLCSVLLLQPVVAAVVITEALLTWALVRGIDASATRVGFIFPVFGRDRFFLMLVASVGVRIILEGFVLQHLADLGGEVWPTLQTHRSELFGIGVVLVPLTANRLWRPGAVSGAIQLAAQVGMTFAVVGVLSRLTNFSIGGFELAYDHLALAFLSSPRAQIALLITAAMASHFNRSYGWDYHGILVPALLALAVLAPMKLVTTCLEAVLIVGVARAVLSHRALRNANVEGPRKLVLCFVIGFFAKLLLTSFMASRYPGYRAYDFFGFGYLLPSLLAERIWLKSNAGLVLIPTFQTALLGTTAAALLVIALGRFWPAPPLPEDDKVERYRTLLQAVSSLLPAARRGASVNLGDLIATLREGGGTAESADGYRIAVSGRAAGLVALPPRAYSVVTATLSQREAETAARVAVASGAALVLGVDADAAHRVATQFGSAFAGVAPPLPMASIHALTVSARERALALLLERPAQREMAPPPRALAETAFRMARDDLDSPDLRLAEDLEPLGLTVERSSDGLLVVSGTGWPIVVLRSDSGAVVAALHGEEFDTPQAALFAAEVIHADCVVPTPASNADVGWLAAALAERRGRPLLMVRGTAELPTDAVLLARPAGLADPSWLAPLLRALAPRLRVSRALDPAHARLAAFPAHLGTGMQSAILWLSAEARRSLVTSSTELDEPDLVALAKSRGVSTRQGDLATWLAGSTGAPALDAIEVIERLARTRDVAMWRPQPSADNVSIFVDRARGLAGFALEDHGRRAVALAGDRVETRTKVRDASAVGAALAAGTRTLLGAGAW